MKKILSLAACSALVLGFAATASAIHMEAPAQTSPVVAKGGLIHLDGAVRMRGASETRGLTDSTDTSNSNYDGRVRLGVHVQTSDAISGYVLLSSGNDHDDTYTWGEDAGLLGSLNNGGNMHSATADGGLSILEAWINYMPSNWGVKVGHMPLSLGHKVFFDHTQYGDDAIVAYMNPSDATHLGALTIKVSELSAISTDDTDAYVVFATHKVSDALDLGVNYTMIHAGSWVQENALSGINDSANFSNLGVTVDGMVGAISYGLDGEFQFGDSLTAATNGSIDSAKGMAFKGNVDMDLGGAKVGALLGWTSGDDDADDGDDSTFFDLLSDTNYDTLIVGYRHAVPGNADNQYGNLLTVQLNGSMATKCPLTGKDLKLKAAVSYMKLNQTIGNEDDNVGTEADLFATWTLGNGLIYKVEAGYLWSGDAYATNMNIGNADDSANGYFLRHRMELTW